MRATLTLLVLVLALACTNGAGAAGEAPWNRAAPNVPENEPAFPGQTRAPAIRTRTAIQVTEIASGLERPWAIAFLPDRRMLVTEKPTGRLYLVGLDGTGLERVTTHADFDSFPMFSPDGRRLVWASNRHAAREGETNIFVADWRD